MKTITEIIGGAQGLPDISFDSRDVFEEYLTEKYKTFPHMLRVPEEAQKPLVRGYAGTGRIPLSVPAVCKMRLGQMLSQNTYDNGINRAAKKRS